MTPSSISSISQPLFDRVSGFLKKLLRKEAAASTALTPWNRILLNFGASLLGRAVAIVCNLISIPFGMHFLGVEVYGIWATLTGGITLLSFLDLGLGIGLQNRLSALIGSESRHEIASCVRSSIVLSASLAVLFSLVLLSLIWLTPIVPFIFNNESFSSIQLKPCLSLLVISVVTALPLNLFPRIALGLQHGWLIAAGNALTAILTLATIYIASRLHANLPTYIGITILAPLVSNFVLILILRHLEPSVLHVCGAVSFKDGYASLKKGAHYVLPQISGAILTQAPTALLGTLGAPSAAALFNVLSRLSSPFSQIQQMLLLQTWPSLTEAIYRKDLKWLLKTVRTLLRTVVASSFISSLVLFFASVSIPRLISPDHSLVLPKSTAVAFAAFTFLFMITQSLAFINNSLEATKSQNLLAFINIVFVIFVLPKCATLDVIAVFLGLSGLALVFALPALLIELRLVLKHFRVKHQLA
ncbi:MAG: hypothetical protein IPP19_12875 [Verrucomicrobia bacterium]|nr:hypothetical protein [Verrucomicrobiota bacterium]